MRDNPAFNLQRFIVSVLLVGVTLVVGIYVTDSLGSNLDQNIPLSVTNETNAFGNVTGYLLSGYNSSWTGIGLTSAWAVEDGEYNVTVPLANLSVSAAGVLTNATAATYANLSVSYDYTFSDAPTPSSTAAGNVVTALATGTSWISILVVVGFAVIILTMLTSGLGNAAGRQEEVPYY